MDDYNKQQGEDPWKSIEQHYKPGQLVTGTITKIVPFGVFARIEDSFEGLVPSSELPSWLQPMQNLHEGQQLPLRILFIDAERHRMRLSLLRVDEAK